MSCRPHSGEASMAQHYVELAGSVRAAPRQATLIQEVPAGERLEISLYLKDYGPDPLIGAKPLSAQQARLRRSTSQTREGLRAARAEQHVDDVAKVVDFASRTGLSVVKQEPGRRLVKLSGTVAQLEAAFRTKLHYYSDGSGTFRARTGALYAPGEVAAALDGVFGFDTRRAARPKLVRHIDPHAMVGHLPNQVAKLYGFPTTPRMGRGQCIALIELGGGYRDSDNKAAFQ